MSPGNHRSLCLNNENRSLRDDLFTVMPQNPHCKPLDRYCEGIREGIKVGLDIVFINLAQKFVSLTSPVELLSDLEEYVAQLLELDEMGYDCTKIWERFDTLRALSEQEQVSSLKLEETTSKRRDKEVNATIIHTRISELESELKAVSKTREEEIETLKLTERSYIEEKESNLQEFRSAATAPW
ncbi:hypothetical protein MKW98_022612 [Papaver atlanticum]|uniref:Uncharacterized protein n=1 Tax=Papaver atlanticum TaxID=357466 RepID=A0AAD4XG57_9MAGN|nr:hypothetical protein MKW98_022612 [Papaver atlanticum]